MNNHSFDADCGILSRSPSFPFSFNPQKQTNLFRTMKNVTRTFVCWTVLFAAASVFVAPTSKCGASDQIPGGPQKKPILIQNGTVHTVSSGTLANTSVLVRDGKIAEIGPAIAAAEGYEVIDASGKHIYPGLVDSYSSTGLVEIDSIRASIDNSEGGDLNPNVRALAAVNPDSEAIPVARANGVLASVIAPSGGLVSGRAAFIQLDGWTWEDMTIKSDLAMVVNWPRFGGGGGPRRGGGPREPAAAEGDGASAERLAPFHQLIRETKAYAAAKAADPSLPIDLRLQALIPVVEGKTPIMVTANSIKQIQTAVAFSQQHGLKVILFGGADAMHVAGLLREAKVPVVLPAVYRLPARRDSPYDSSYSLPSELKAAGIPFSIASGGQFGASFVRNLPYQAAAAVGFGLSHEDALRAITLSPAEIFGVADRVGSLDIGKDGTLFISDGDILETATQVQNAWIQGRKVDLTSKHTKLYDKYKVKYEQLKTK